MKKILLSIPDAMKNCASHGKRKNKSEISNTKKTFCSYFVNTVNLIKYFNFFY